MIFGILLSRIMKFKCRRFKVIKAWILVWSLLLFIGSFVDLKSQSYLVVSSDIHPDLDVCIDTMELKVIYDNPSPYTLTEVECTLTLPQGLNYLEGSVVGASESNLSNLSAPVFTIDDIDNLTYDQELTVRVYASCNYIDFHAPGEVVSDTVIFEYVAAGSTITEQHITDQYIVGIPEVAINNIVPQTVNAYQDGDTVSRCIFITNTGSGRLDDLTLNEVSGNSIQTLSYNLGAWSPLVNGGNLYLGGTVFSAFGNGDAFLDPGETVEVCETLVALNCISLFSDFEAYWGCGIQECQSSTNNSNVIFPEITPNIILTPLDSIHDCLGTVNTDAQGILITNAGLGQALNLNLEIFQGYDGNMVVGMKSWIEASSFTLTDLNGGGNVSFTLTQLVNTTASCTPGNGAAKVLVVIDSVSATDSLLLQWENNNCCASTLSGTRDIAAWLYKGTYNNVCYNEFILPTQVGKARTRVTESLGINYVPGTIVGGNNYTLDFLLDNYYNTYPKGTNYHWKYKIDLSNCLDLVGNNIYITSADGSQTWNPSSVSVFLNEVTVIFDGDPPFNINKGSFKIEVQPKCPSCNNGNATVSIQSFYIPDDNCFCEVAVSSVVLESNVVCPVASCPGMTVLPFEVYRTTYGEPDNDDNGLADGAGTLDFNKIRRDRAMYGDTFVTIFKGIVHEQPPFINFFPYGYAESRVSNAHLFDPVEHVFEVYRGGALLATCNQVNVATTNLGGNEYNYKYDISVAQLGSCNPALPGGFNYEENDSVVLKIYYRVNDVASGTDQSIFENKMYVSVVPNPIPSQQLYCNDYQGSIVLVGYGYDKDLDDLVLTSCGEKNFTSYFSYEIGPCCNNGAGGNLFPFEYRNWAVPSTVKVALPYGFDVVSALYSANRTAGTNNSVNQSINVTPSMMLGDTLVYNIAEQYLNQGGTIAESDDGFGGSLSLRLKPTCEATVNINQPGTFIWEYETIDQMFDSPLSKKLADTSDIIYQGPELFIQSALPNISAVDSVSYWDLLITNVSNVMATNVWIAAPQVSGVQVLGMVDTSNFLPIVNNGDFYYLDTIPAIGQIGIRIYGSFTYCSKDSILVYTGWSCDGYPTSLNNHPCIDDTIRLQLTPQSPNIKTEITVESPVSLCEDAEVIIKATNIQSGTAHHLSLDVQLPQGVAIIPGSCELLYPSSSAYTNIPDPVNTSGTNYNWDLSATNLLDNGLKGFVNSDSNQLFVRFLVETNCEFFAGSKIKANVKGRSICGVETNQFLVNSNKLNINGVFAPYQTSFNLKTTYISPCANNTLMEVTIFNNGPGNFGAGDSIIFTLPYGVSYIDNSVQNLHNSNIGNPQHVLFNEDDQLFWKLEENVAMGDSVVFSFQYTGAPDSLDCGITEFEIQTINSATANCVSSGDDCDIKVINGDSTIPVYIYKADLLVLNSVAIAVPNGVAGEDVDFELEIYNAGQTIANGNHTYLAFYADDGDGIFNSADNLLYIDTITNQIDSGATFIYQNNLDIPAGQACQMHLVIDSVLNPCNCGFSSFLIDVDLINLAVEDTIVCALSDIEIGSEEIPGYVYSWVPNIDLNDPSLSNPTFTNNTSQIDTVEYIVYVDRINCNTSDTVEIILLPPTLANAGEDSSLCALYTFDAYANDPGIGYIGMWSQVEGPVVATIQDPDDPTSTITDLQEGTYLFEWAVMSGSCDTAKDTIMINVYDIPVAFAGLDSQSCNVSNLTLFADSLEGTMTGMWNQLTNLVNPISFDDVTLFNTQISDLETGAYLLEWEVNNGTCPADLDTVELTILPTPEALTTSDVELCDSTQASLSSAQSLELGFSHLWEQASGPSIANILNPTDSATLVTGLVPGAYTFTWIVSNVVCGADTDSISITIYDDQIADVGPDLSLCDSNQVELGASPVMAESYGVWQQIGSVPSLLSFNDSSLSDANVSGFQEGDYQLEWYVNNGACPESRDTLQVEIRKQPLSNAGLDSVLCADDPFQLFANEPLGLAQGEWTQLSGPSNLIIDDVNAATSNVGGLVEGVYMLQWKISNDPCPADSDAVEVIYAPIFSQTMNDTSLCGVYEIEIYANEPGPLSEGLWQQINGPNMGIVADSNNDSTFLLNLIEGEYIYIWKVFNSYCDTAVDTLRIHVFDAPVANAGEDTTLCDGNAFTLYANQPSGTMTGAWSQLTNLGQNIQFDDASLYNTGISNLSVGSFELEWEVSNGVCPVEKDTIKMEILPSPEAETIMDIELCDEGSAIIASAIPFLNGFSYEWQQLSGPNASSIANVNDSSTEISLLQPGNYIYQLVASNQLCGSDSDSIAVTIYNYQEADAGMDRDLCDSSSITLQGNDPGFGSEGTWSQLSGLASTLVFADENNAQSEVSNFQEGTYQLQWFIDNGICASSSDTIEVNISFSQFAQAGTDQIICDTADVFLQGNAPTGNAIGIWSELLGQPASFSDPFSNVSQIDGLEESLYQFEWQITNGACPPSKDTVVYVVYQPNIADAGADIEWCDQTIGVLEANPLNDEYTQGVWSQFSSANIVSYSHQDSNSTNISGAIEGTYNFVWTVSDGNCPTSKDTVVLTSYFFQGANAGLPQTYCGLQDVGLSATPVNGLATGNWVYLGNGAGVSITEIEDPYSTVTGLPEGEHSFEWGVLNGPCTPDYDTLIISLFEMPMANAGVDANLCEVDSLVLDANQITGTSTGMWDQLSGPNQLTFLNDTLYNTEVNNFISGVYELEWVVSNGVCPEAKDTIRLVYAELPIVSFTGDSNAVVCKGGCVNVLDQTTVVSDSIISWVWAYGNSTAIGSNPELCFDDTGVFDVQLTVTTALGCEASFTDSSYIEIGNNPTADFEIQQLIDQFQISMEDPFMDVLNQSQNADVFEWFLFLEEDTIEVSDGYNFNYQFDTDGDYSLLLVAKDGQCIDTLQKPFTVIPISYIYVPNAFTPNNDYLNDKFVPVLTNITDYHIMIFERGGDLVFESFDTDTHWSGLFLNGKDAPKDVYSYVIEYRDVEKKLQKLYGMIVLVR